MSSSDSSCCGMSVLELLLAVAMMMVFSGVVAVVMEVTLRLMGEAECPVDVNGLPLCNDENTEDVANGVLIDRQRIEVLFDQLEQFGAAGDSSCESILFRAPWVIHPVKLVLLRHPLQFGQQVPKFLSFLFLHFPVVITCACGPLIFRRHLWKICLTRLTLWQHLGSTFSRPCRPS